MKNGREVLSNVISSQIELHKLYGGVVPEIASRKHVEKINPVIREALAEAGMKLEEMDAIGVTYGPGLVGALLVGVAAAKAISYSEKYSLSVFIISKDIFRQIILRIKIWSRRFSEWLCPADIRTW